ncbi:NACHT domain-containing protein [Burkholderia pseudomallei]|uniref:NACHT domain-containing protein n=1 Tax=Burkholderia pseudomallei TaxID=28450 RepID=UPI00052A7F03|nr:NACHT domain-containing protein [Burkholderia pseudomallei]AIV67264.1 NACHT domain protein [Burkholderia pseudomallei K42]
MNNPNGGAAQPTSIVPLSFDAQSILGVIEKLWTSIVGDHPLTLTNIVLIVWLVVGLIRLSSAALEWVNKALAQWAIFADNWGLNSSEQGPARRERQYICDVLNHRIVSLNHAESWSSIPFTDMEAEIEVEGQQYSSALAKLLDRPIDGRRKVNRLVNAIQNSTASRILLVGEPGSGKSIALRTLAMDLGVLARKARGSYVIPLYVNLRGLEKTSDMPPTAQAIEAFVRSNAVVDSVAAKFVQKHWDEYLRDGKWCFLLDSFDEIPAVLHEGNGSKVVRQYAEAIQAFADVTGRCRVIVASREYKAPPLEKWTRFHVLQLSTERQERMIAQSLASRESRRAVRSYIAERGGDAFRNPMFLALLCADITAEGRLPRSDFDLLNRHLENLTLDGSELPGVNVSSGEALDMARHVARVLAVNKELGLAPSVQQLSHHLRDTFIDEDRIRQLLDALVFMKVLRTDTWLSSKETVHFTFVHRRYQEALVVQQVATRELPVASETMLCDGRWREYAVTLFQTQPACIIQPYLDDAIKLLPTLAAEVTAIVGGFAGEKFEYFALEDSTYACVLKLLQDGLRNRHDIRPDTLSSIVEETLDRFWSNGDLVNQHTALTLYGLASAAQIERKTSEVIQQPSELEHRIAFENLSYLENLSADLAAWVRLSLANQILDARKLADLWRIEAVVARLPSVIGAENIWKRCRRLRHPILLAYLAVKPFIPVAGLFVKSLDLIGQPPPAIRRSGYPDGKSINRSIFSFVMLLLWAGLALASLAVALSYFAKVRIGPFLWASLALAWAYAIRTSISYMMRSTPTRLTPETILGAARHWHKTRRPQYSAMLQSAAKIVLVFGLGIGIIVSGLYGLSRWAGVPLPVIFMALYGISVLSVFVAIPAGMLKKRASFNTLRRRRAELKQIGHCEGNVLVEARGPLEVRWWLSAAREELLSTEVVRRSFISWIVGQPTDTGWRSGAKQENLRRLAWEEIEEVVSTAYLKWQIVGNVESAQPDDAKEATTAD